MNRVAGGLALWAALAGAGCRQARPADAPASTPASPVAATQSATQQGRQKPMLLSKQAVADAVHNGLVALVTVKTAQLEQAGTRAQKARITASVVNMLSGSPRENIAVVRFSSGTDTVLLAGHSYIIAAVESARYAPALQLVEAVECDAKDAATLQANLAEVKSATASAP